MRSRLPGARRAKPFDRPASGKPDLRHLEYFHDHQRIERMPFDGTLDPDGGAMHPDPGRPGHGLTLRDADAEPFRRR